MEPSASPWSVVGTLSFFVGVAFLVAAALAGVMALIEVVRLRWHVRRFVKSGDL